MPEKLLPPDIKTWWFHRRFHSYLAAGGLFAEIAALITLAILASPETLSAISGVLIVLALCFTAVIITYILAATREDIHLIKELRP